jgi:uncharacterized damage-inducible protein DinB
MDKASLLTDYLNGIQLLTDAVSRFTREQAIARPIAGKWSTLEVVAHLADFEPIYAERVKRIVAMDRPLILAAEENDFARSLAYQERDLSEEVALIASTRRQLAQILRSLPDDVLARQGIHSEIGLVSAEQFVQQAIRHIRHHAPFIHEKKRALGIA